eukprot:4406840-Amphidinium_carterae.1
MIRASAHLGCKSIASVPIPCSGSLPSVWTQLHSERFRWGGRGAGEEEHLSKAESSRVVFCPVCFLKEQPQRHTVLMVQLRCAKWMLHMPFETTHSCRKMFLLADCVGTMHHAPFAFASWSGVARGFPCGRGCTGSS